MSPNEGEKPRFCDQKDKNGRLCRLEPGHRFNGRVYAHRYESYMERDARLRGPDAPTPKMMKCYPCTITKVHRDCRGDPCVCTCRFAPPDYSGNGPILPGR